MKDIKINSKGYIPEQHGSDQRHQELKKACREFESIFTYELLKSMRRTIEKCDLFHGGQAEEIYESMLDQELSKKMAGGEKSLAALLYRQLSRDALPAEIEEQEMPADEGLDHMTPALPLKASVTSEFGWRQDPFNGQARYHYGIDLGAAEGSLVRAVLPGKVIKSDYQDAYGNVVVLDHGNGLTTLYAHNQANNVQTGDWVRGGTPIARVGSTGRSTGSHLHFEVRRFGKHLDPAGFIETKSET